MIHCELVGTGVYTFDWDGESDLGLSSQRNTERYNTVIETADLFNNNEPATMQMTAPLGSFLNNNERCNVYLKDEFPLLIVTENNSLFYRAPYRPN